MNGGDTPPMNDSLAHPTTPVPGVVIDCSDAPASKFLGSPSLVRLPDGTLLASHDWFGPGTGSNEVSVLASGDHGQTWQPRARVPELFWPTLFYHRDAAYLLGCDGEYGAVVIRRSADGGRTWTRATDGSNGRLRSPRNHGAPMPVVIHGGRIWRGIEAVVGEAGWPRHFQAMVMSAPVDADLLQAASWTFSTPLAFDPAWLSGSCPGWLEGNVVVAPDGTLRNLLRTHAAPGWDDPMDLPAPLSAIARWELASLVRVSADGRSLAFDPARDFIQFPGSQSKFTVRFDPVSRRYWSLVQKITNPHTGYDPRYSPYHQRHVLVLTSSADLRHWREERRVLRYREGRVMQTASPVGFQYADWIFDGDDLLAVVRTGWSRAANYHDANFVTFHRIPDFRHPPATEPPDLAA